MTIDPSTAPGPDGVDADDLAARLRVLARLGLGAPGTRFDEIAAAMAVESGVPDAFAMVNLITTEQVFVGLHTPPGTDPSAVGRTMALSQGWCPEVQRRRRALPLPDVFAAPRFAGNPVVDLLGIRAYYGTPLIPEPDGVAIGTVCVIAQEPQSLQQARQVMEVLNQGRDAVLQLIAVRAGARQQ